MIRPIRTPSLEKAKVLSILSMFLVSLFLDELADVLEILARRRHVDIARKICLITFSSRLRKKRGLWFFLFYFVLAADQGMITLVDLLDYSAAFDTVDHQITMDILENRCGISTSSLTWCRSYLSGRSFSVLSDTEMSATVNLTCSLPQGSTPGPLFCVTYASELQNVAERHDVGFHGYAADDT